MKKTNRCLIVIAAAMVASPAFAQMEWRPTNWGGADAEVRESNADQNRGDSTEIASRVKNALTQLEELNNTSDRNSAIYTQFDLSYRSLSTLPDDFTTAFRMTYRNSNLNGSRIQDTTTPNPDVRTGLAIYGLKTSTAGADWQEDQITYNNAPGITPDGDIGTKDFNSDLTFLGTVLFPEIGNQNHLPIGAQLVFSSAALDAFVRDAILGGAPSVTLVSTVIHGGDAPFGNWINFNYLFNPKEQTTINNDNYDADVTDPNNLTGNYTGQDNSGGAFSPSLYLPVPEPSTLALAGLSVAALLIFRRRS